MKKIRSIVSFVIISIFIITIAVLCITHAQEKYSTTERRALASLPDLDLENVVSGEFMDGFEDYALDQFPGRDKFRTIKALSGKYLFNTSDSNGYYLYNGYISKLNYPMSEAMVNNSISKLTNIYNKYLMGTNCNVYLSIIPDKNYYIANESGHLCLDYNDLINQVCSGLDFASYIDITDDLDIGCYYKTDTHWRQEKIIPVANKLLLAMGNNIISSNLETHELSDIDFSGVYLGQSAYNVDPDKISYITSEILDKCSLISYNTGKSKPSQIYNFDNASGKDPYEFFMSGSDALQVLVNPSNNSGKELVIFRDSFGSSITPLLAEGYSKITLVDIRYIYPDLIGSFVDFDSQDILFMYSTILLNDSQSFK